MPLRAIRFLGSPSRRFPHRRRLPSLGFLNPSTVCTPKNLVGLFHPTRTSRLRPPGFFPRSEQIRLVAVSCPHAVTADEPHRCRYDSPATPLQGFDSPCESVASIPQLSSFDARYPPGLSPLQGLLSHGRGFHFGKPPLSSFQASRTRRPLVAPQGLDEPENRFTSREVSIPLEVLGLFESSHVQNHTGSGLSFRLGANAASPLRRLPL